MASVWKLFHAFTGFMTISFYAEYISVLETGVLLYNIYDL